MIAVSFVTNAQIKFPFGSADAATFTIADTTTTGVIDVTDLYDNVSIYTVTCDTNITINADTTQIRTSMNNGAVIYFKVTEATKDADTITWGTNLTGTATAIPSGKTTIVKFVKIGTGFYKVSDTQVN